MKLTMAVFSINGLRHCEVTMADFSRPVMINSRAGNVNICVLVAGACVQQVFAEPVVTGLCVRRGFAEHIWLSKHCGKQWRKEW
jgi:hypothetical protein